MGFLIANGGMTAGLQVSIFLTSAAVDLVRKRAIDGVVVHPLEPLAKLVNDLIARGGRVWACTPCVKACGYEQRDLIDEVEITGASKMHELIKAGAATPAFEPPPSQHSPLSMGRCCCQLDHARRNAITINAEPRRRSCSSKPVPRHVVFVPRAGDAVVSFYWGFRLRSPLEPS
jgi:predicted peroxiredoxin